MRKVDGVIIVGRVGRNRRDIAERLHETLTGAGAPLLGVVANGVKASGPGSYAYAYDYAQAGSTTRPPSPSAIDQWWPVVRGASREDVSGSREMEYESVCAGHRDFRSMCGLLES